MQVILNIQNTVSSATGDTTHIENIIAEWLKMNVHVERITLDN